MECGDNESDSGRMMSKERSEASLCPTEEDEEFTPTGPKCSIKEHLEKDKVIYTYIHYILSIHSSCIYIYMHIIISSN